MPSALRVACNDNGAATWEGVAPLNPAARGGDDSHEELGTPSFTLARCVRAHPSRRLSGSPYTSCRQSLRFLPPRIPLGPQRLYQDVHVAVLQIRMHFSERRLRGDERRHGERGGGGAEVRGSESSPKSELLRLPAGSDRLTAHRISPQVCILQRPRSESPFRCSYRRRSSYPGGRRGPARIQGDWCSLVRSKPKPERMQLTR